MHVLPCTTESIAEVTAVLQAGGTVVYPTETAYAIGADPFQPAAVERVFAIKRRMAKKPLGLIVDSLAMAEQLCIFNEQERSLAQKHWPGPLSLVLQVRVPADPDERRAWRATLGGSDRASIRVPGFAWARNLVTAFGRPLITTSANRSGDATCYDVQCVLEQCTKHLQPDLIIDCGPLARGHLSTVVLVKDGTIHVLRQGVIRIATS